MKWFGFSKDRAFIAQLLLDLDTSSVGKSSSLLPSCEGEIFVVLSQDFMQFFLESGWL